MGSKARDAQPNEQPITNTTISCFYMSRFPVTNGQYEKFDLSHTSKRAPWADANHPAVYVSAVDAEKFCEWLSRIEGRRYRLPTEAEWEYAARGPDNLIYPWGNTFEPESVAFGMLNPVDVGDHPAGRSWVGANDLSGSILEWVADWYAPYPSQPQQNPQGPSNGEQRVARGGAWFSYAPFQLRAAQRYPQDPTFATSIIGFRCAGDFGS
jgi:toxoflavin biosynthesis protein ToxD